LKVSADWFKEFFGPSYIDAVASASATNEAQTLREISLIQKYLNCGEATHILDVCCGHGRHALELARRSCRVVGIDIDEEALRTLSRQAEAEGLQIGVHRTDVRDLALHEQFHITLCMLNSFGYFCDELNQAVLGNMAKSLLPGGTLILDLPNRERIFHDVRFARWEETTTGLLVLGTYCMDLWSGRLKGMQHRVYPDGNRLSKAFSLRVYSLVEMVSMLRRVGMDLANAWGDFDCSPYSIDSPRMILVARRKA
jgi:SAM-dependent methyltransferase